MIRLSCGISSDKTRITAYDKTSLASDWDNIKSKYNGYIQAATAAGLTTSNCTQLADYEAAYTALNYYLNTSPGVLMDLTVTTVVKSSDFNSVYSSFYSSQTILLAQMDTDAPTDTITDASIAYTDNNDGTITAKITISIAAGSIQATHLIAYYVSGAAAPAAINVNTAQTVSSNRLDGIINYTIIIPGLVKKSSSVCVHYRFAVATASVKSSGVYISTQGLYDKAIWQDVYFDTADNWSGINKWNFETGELQAGTDSAYFKIDQTNKVIEHPGLSLNADTADEAREALYAPPPIGFVYTQYPGEKTPGSLYPNTTWTKISGKFAGLFDRFEGGSADTFERYLTIDTTKANTVSSIFFTSVHNLVVGSPIISSTGELRTVAGVNSTTQITVDTPFSTIPTGTMLPGQCSTTLENYITSGTNVGLANTDNSTSAYSSYVLGGYNGVFTVTSFKLRPDNFTKRLWRRDA